MVWFRLTPGFYTIQRHVHVQAIGLPRRCRLKDANSLSVPPPRLTHDDPDQAEDDAAMTSERQKSKEMTQQITDRAKKAESKHAASERQLKNLDKEMKRLTAEAKDQAELASIYESQHGECSSGHASTTQTLNDALKEGDALRARVAALETARDAAIPLSELWAALKNTLSQDLALWYTPR